MEQSLSLRYYDSKMNITYNLEELRAQYVLDKSENNATFEDWIHEMVESEILIPLS